MKKILVFLSVFLFVSLAVLQILPVHGEEEVYDSVIRLHVLANSDGEEDQAVKRKVRDAVLEQTADWFSECHSQEEALQILTSRQAELIATADAVLQKEGFDYSASLLLGEEEYPTRSYDEICFPAGKYLSLRILLGSGDGQNWWCCLFPPLCLKGAQVSAKDAENSFIAVGLTSEQYRVITETDTPRYRIRFRILELLQGTEN